MSSGASAHTSKRVLALLSEVKYDVETFCQRLVSIPLLLDNDVMRGKPGACRSSNTCSYSPPPPKESLLLTLGETTSVPMRSMESWEEFRVPVVVETPRALCRIAGI